MTTFNVKGTNLQITYCFGFTSHKFFGWFNLIALISVISRHTGQLFSETKVLITPLYTTNSTKRQRNKASDKLERKVTAKYFA